MESWPLDLQGASWDYSVKIMGLWKKAVPNPNPNPNPEPQTPLPPLPALGVLEGQVSVWGSQLGPRIR